MTEAQEQLRRLCFALQSAPVGMLIFVELDSASARSGLPERLRQLGLDRSFQYFNFKSYREGVRGGFVAGNLHQFASVHPAEILFVDGFESRDDFKLQHQAGDALESLTLGREAITQLGAVVVFLMPRYVIDLVRGHALNVWSWRGYDFQLNDPDEQRVATRYEGGERSVLESSHPMAFKSLEFALDMGLAASPPLPGLVKIYGLRLLEALNAAGRYQRAAEWIQRVGPLAEALEGADRATWERLVALNLLSRGEDREARRLLESALALQTDHHVDELEIAKTESALGQVAYNLRELSECERLWKKVLAVWARHLGPNAEEVAQTFVDLGWLWLASGELASAERDFQRALEIAQRGSFSRREAASLRGLAIVRHEQGRYVEAASLLERSREVLIEAVGEQHPSLAAHMSDLAHMLTHSSEYERAEHLACRALEIASDVNGFGDPLAQKIIKNLADIYRKQGKEAEAEALAARSAAGPGNE